MSRLSTQRDECFIVVKALPHRSSDYFETVCCAGLGRDGRWRRLYPVPFRILQRSSQFKRWDWIEYEYTSPKTDDRWESQRVDADTLSVSKALTISQRPAFINPLIRASLVEAADRGESLALVRPRNLDFTAKRKSDAMVADETRKHAEYARQYTMFDKPVDPMKPCPFSFHVKWTDQDGRTHNHTCDDWETTTAFYRRSKDLGDKAGIVSLKETYENDYMRRGMALAFSTHSRRKSQWLLVGMIRIDEDNQSDLFLS